MKPIIIIGSGTAGYTLAREFRVLDQDTALHIITADDGRFYPKPQLSSAFTNNRQPADLVKSTCEQQAEAFNATIHTHCEVTAINPVAKTISTTDGDFEYSKLIFACGASPIDPGLNGDAVEDVVCVNCLQDYEQFRTTIKDKKHLTIIGGGLVGCEFANDLRNGGFDVDVISLGKTPLDTLMPAPAGEAVQRGLTEHGIGFHMECTASTINKTERGYELILNNSKTIQTDLVLSAIGLRPNTQLALAAGIECNRGIKVNRQLETNIDDIYAIGDCAEVDGHVLQYIRPINSAAKALAQVLNGQPTPVHYPPMPIGIKTPACPISVAPPAVDAEGEWEFETEGNNVKGLFKDKAGQLCGFVLTGEEVKHKLMFSKELPDIIPA